ncbi:hypothetical protein RND81_03G092100 [Saponaria officinalis]|uniref:DNA-3-methyladenine glycosylase I n=1 Tax=Saponaria officinalis TaxID=3572 RepID=A0AAW1M791_SAPOF
MITVERKLMSSPSVDGGPVLRPTCKLFPKPIEGRKSLDKRITPTPPSSTLGSPRPPAIKRGCENNGLNTSSDKIIIPRSTLTRSLSTLEVKKSKKLVGNNGINNNSNISNYGNSNDIDSSLMSSYSYSSSLITKSPGSIAAVRREQMAIQTAHRKMRIAHYGRSKSAKYESKVSPLIDSVGNVMRASETIVLERRCTSVTPNSDPLYVAYHDEEWGVPIHDDKRLFELLVLSGAQVGSDWASILRKRQDYRDAFAGFDAEIVANFTEKQIITIATQYAIDISRVRGVVDNATRILEIKLEYGSFSKYIWGFVNGKPICPQYKFANKIPVKTSKSESISKDMVRRGFRTVGPTAVYSFMQAAGLTNDHLTTCYRHLECSALASSSFN